MPVTTLLVGLITGWWSSCTDRRLGIDNNNNSHDNVYGAVVMTKVIARVHAVHLMNVD